MVLKGDNTDGGEASDRLEYTPSVTTISVFFYNGRGWPQRTSVRKSSQPASSAAVRTIFPAKPQQAEVPDFLGQLYCEIARSCYVAHTFMTAATGLVD